MEKYNSDEKVCNISKTVYSEQILKSITQYLQVCEQKAYNFLYLRSTNITIVISMLNLHLGVDIRFPVNGVKTGILISLKGP